MKISKEGTSIPARLASAYNDFRRHCKRTGEYPFVKHFTRENLGWTSLKTFPECSFKGSDTRLILSFLLHYMGQESTSLDAIGTEAFIAAKGIDDFLRMIFSKDNKRCKKSLWSKEEAISAASMLEVYIHGFYKCAAQCYDSRLCFFNITPKFHYICHVSFDLFQQINSVETQWVINPAVFATQMAKDATGRSCRMARTTHVATTSLRVAQKWLIACKLQFENKGKNWCGAVVKGFFQLSRSIYIYIYSLSKKYNCIIIVV